MKHASLPRLSIDDISEFSYDSATGKLFRSNIETGACGRVRVNGRGYQTSYIVWMLHYGEYPEKHIDHVDTNHSNNNIDNLRLASLSENQWNKSAYNPHGYKGVTWRNRKKNPWVAKIRVKGVRYNLGSFPTKELAASAYEKAAIQLHKEFVNLGVK